MKAGSWNHRFWRALRAGTGPSRMLAPGLVLVLVALLAACSSGPVRRVSPPSALVQQLTVQADGTWSVDLRIENFSSIPMRFETVELVLTIGDEEAGRVSAQPAIPIGPESADVVTAVLAPQAAGKLAVADALAGRRSIAYTLQGTISATPDATTRQRRFEVRRNSQLTPAPGLPGVLR